MAGNGRTCIIIGIPASSPQVLISKCDNNSRECQGTGQAITKGYYRSKPKETRERDKLSYRKEGE